MKNYKALMASAAVLFSLVCSAQKIDSPYPVSNQLKNEQALSGYVQFYYWDGALKPCLPGQGAAISLQAGEARAVDCGCPPDRQVVSASLKVSAPAEAEQHSFGQKTVTLTEKKKMTLSVELAGASVKEE